MPTRTLLLFVCLGACLTGWAQPEGQKKIWLDELELGHITSGWRAPRPRKAVDSDTIRIGGRAYAHGVGTHATCLIHVKLDGRATRFYSEVGVDDKVAKAATMEPGTGVVSFAVLGDGRLLYESDTVRAGERARIIDLDVRGVWDLYLLGDQLGTSHHDHIDFADAYFFYEGQAPYTAKPIAEAEYILTPPTRPEPLYNGAPRYGVRPGRPVQIYLAFTGTPAPRITAEGLSAGLRYHPAKRTLEGRIDRAGNYPITLTARNNRGSARVTVKIVAGDTLALTPPMGWNSWNCWGMTVTAARVHEAARAMKRTGLADYGYRYVNIDDGWQGARNAQGDIEPNERFPDMARLADSVHALGLKVGLYSPPGPKTCGGLEGSYQHEARDAATYARWGFDFLKYDRCSYGPMMPNPPARADHVKPYALMGQLIHEGPSEIVYSLCQYGTGEVWEWGPTVHGSLWRTTGDIVDTWESVTSLVDMQYSTHPYAGPGRFNDPDMLVVGWLGWSQKLHKTRLTPSEQYAHISMWSMLSAPLLLGCDLTRLDAFTLNLLTNREVLAINQDELGRQATRVYADTGRFPWAQAQFIEVWRKPLANGDVAVAILNRGSGEATYALDLSLVGMPGGRVRDIWRQKPVQDPSTVRVPRHGVALYRVSRAGRTP